MGKLGAPGRIPRLCGAGSPNVAVGCFVESSGQKWGPEFGGPGVAADASLLTHLLTRRPASGPAAICPRIRRCRVDRRICELPQELSGNPEIGFYDFGVRKSPEKIGESGFRDPHCFE